MVTQSRAPVVLLTRPAAQSDRFAEALLDRFPDATIVTSPLLAPRFVLPPIPRRDWSAVIFTSQTAVEAARRIVADGTQLPARAFCVGNQTAMAAAGAGFDPLSADGDARDLVSLMVAQSSTGPMLYLHGRETRGDIAEALLRAGIETVSIVVYAQDLHPLTPEAVALLLRPDPVLAPVFSPRSADALANECTRIKAKAPLAIIAISQAAASAFGPGDITIAARPDAVSMIEATALRWKAQSKP